MKIESARESKEILLSARLNDEDDESIYLSIYLSKCECVYVCVCVCVCACVYVSITVYDIYSP